MRVSQVTLAIERGGLTVMFLLGRGRVCVEEMDRLCGAIPG